MKPEIETFIFRYFPLLNLLSCNSLLLIRLSKFQLVLLNETLHYMKSILILMPPASLLNSEIKSELMKCILFLTTPQALISLMFKIKVISF